MMYRAGGAPPAGIPAELRRHRRGTRAGTKARLRRETHRRFKPCLPSIVMGNVRSLANKTDELTALASGQCVYRECSLLCFTETWLHRNIPDCAIELAGFTLARADRGRLSGKKKGGGLAVFVNTKWCKPWTCYRQREHLYSRYRTVSCGSEAILSARL
jgi:ribosome assembly protein 1